MSPSEACACVLLQVKIHDVGGVVDATILFHMGQIAIT